MQIGREIRRVVVARREHGAIPLPGITPCELLDAVILMTMALYEGRIPLEYLLPVEAPPQSAEAETVRQYVALASARGGVA